MTEPVWNPLRQAFDAQHQLSQEQCAELIGHCYETNQTQAFPAAANVPEGGWPVMQSCRHCGKRRQRVTTITYEDV